MGAKCVLHFKVFETSAQLAAVSKVFAGQDWPAILGGNHSECVGNNFSVWACGPIEIFEFVDGLNPLEMLDEVVGKYKVEGDTGSLPSGMFCGGWIGYFGYELGRYIENIPVSSIDDLKMPLIRLGFYDRAVVYDHENKKWYLVALQVDGDDVEKKFRFLESLLGGAEKTEAPKFEGAEVSAADIEKVKRNISKDYYLYAIEKIRRYIYDGEVYQINFSHRFKCEYSAKSVNLYHWQNEFNPSPYAAFLGYEDFDVVSASPEMFLTIDGFGRESLGGRKILTKPIKGTRPRLTEGKDFEKVNRVNFRELIESEKEQAELCMIIDLERNDLTRFCEYGTIKVVQPRAIEEYPTVYHAVSTIEGEMRSGMKFSDVMRGMYPGGSITGAPKVRAMEIIDELEPTCRGVYTGSIGYIGVDGSVCLNIAIRTVIIKDGVAYAQSGGGIVADSDPAAEWDESITKVRALVAGIKCVQNFATENTEGKEK